MPNLSQSIFKRLTALGYPERVTEGVCFGLAMMAESAFFMNELPILDLRLRKIPKIKTQYFTKAKEHLQNGLFFSDLDPFIQECIAFFDPLVLYHLPEEYSYLFNQALNQQDMRSFEWLLPKALQGQIFRLDTFSGVYNLTELEEYLNLLKQALEDHSIPRCSFILECGDHAIHIGYVAETQEWTLVDSLDLPIKNYQNLSELAWKIFDSFYNGDEESSLLSREDSIAIFSTKISVDKSFQDALVQTFIRLSAQANWRALHEVTLYKATLYDSINYSWLMMACVTGEKELVKKILSLSNAPLNTKSMTEAHPLYLATLFRQKEVVECLLNHPSIDLSLVRSKTGATVFFIACQLSSDEIVGLYLNNPKIHELINYPDFMGLRPIHVSIVENRKSVFDLLLTKLDYLDLNCVDEDKKSALHYLCIHNRFEMLEQFCGLPGINFELKDAYDRTPFMCVCDGGHFDVARHLYEKYHVNINQVDVNQSSVLIRAVEQNKRELMDFLLDLPTLNLDIQDVNGDTAFICACQINAQDLILKLMQKRLNCTLRNIDGMTGLDILIQNRSWDTITKIRTSVDLQIWRNMESALSAESKLFLSQLFKRKQEQTFFSRHPLKIGFEEPDATVSTKRFKHEAQSPNSIS